MPRAQKVQLGELWDEEKRKNVRDLLDDLDFAPTVLEVRILIGIEYSEELVAKVLGERAGGDCAR
jgi:hypothetical protein